MIRALKPILQLASAVPARIARADLPWVPSPVAGKSSRPLRFLRNDRGFVELLRMEPGLAMGRHRHSGETHAFNLSGTRVLDSGETIGPGDYVYEPAGSIDSWRVIGCEPLVALVVVMGCVEDLDDAGRIRAVATAATRREEYERYCRAQNLPIVDLVDA